MEQPVNKNNDPSRQTEKTLWKFVAILAFVFVLIWFLKTTFNVLLLIFAGALIAIFFRGLAGLIHRKTRVPEKGSLAISIIGTLLLVVLFFIFAGGKIQQQAGELTKTLPSTIERARQQLSQSPAGQQIIQQIQSSGNQKNSSSGIQAFFKSTFGAIGDVYVVLFLGIFFTVSPQVYIKGFIKLIPVRGRPKAEDVLSQIGETLKKWLKGQLLAMLVVAILTAVGLSIIGVPMAFVLALIAGLLNFIPNIGPLIALIPAVLVALMQGPTTALLVAGLYILVQVLESNLITPQIQKKMIDIPPALIIISQLFAGVLTGAWGLILATPLTAVLIVVIRELYIKKQEAIIK